MTVVIGVLPLVVVVMPMLMLVLVHDVESCKRERGSWGRSTDGRIGIKLELAWRPLLLFLRYWKR